MRTLLVVSRAHAETAFRLAEEMRREGEVTILFTGRGTHHTSDRELVERLSRFASLITLETEFDSPLDEVRAINYDEFVEILERCKRTFSWI
jgi:sulfur transfer complex TusBCD TusB component (DsrH family)